MSSLRSGTGGKREADSHYLALDLVSNDFRGTEINFREHSVAKSLRSEKPRANR